MTDLDAAGFADLKRALSASAKGRAFLEHHAREVRALETARILDAVGALTRAVERQRAVVRVEVLQDELRQMSDAIAQTRREIAAIQPRNTTPNRIMQATEELDAIVTATERATTDILGAAEQLQDIVTRLRQSGLAGPLCDEIETHVTDIFMACSFQDITGQRVNKVVNVLRYLEQRVNAMMALWGVQTDGAMSMEEAKRTLADDRYDPADNRPGSELLHGPQSEAAANDQSAIDDLFESEDIEKLASAAAEMNVADLTAAAATLAATGETGAGDTVDLDAETGTPGLSSASGDDFSESESEPIDQDQIDALFG
jgi:chemotaxis regulatin CheY-phosphate phosphatase CheZ